MTFSEKFLQTIKIILKMFVNADQKFENVASKLFLFKHVVSDGTKCVNYQSSKHVYISQTNLWPIL